MIENNVAHGHAHRDFENARAGDVAAHADKFQATRATGALCDEPIDAASENLRNVDKRFNVVDDRRFLPEADLAGKRRLIARLGAMALDGFDERAFFAADVAAGADKNFEIKVEVAAEDFFPKKPRAITAANLFAEDFFLKMIFVADVDDAALRAGNETRDDHTLDEQMRQVGHDEAVLDGARLTFIGVADNVFHGIGLLANKIPLHTGRKSRAAHAFQFGGFELCQDVVPGLGGNEFAHDAVLFVLAIGICFAGNARLLGMRLVNVVAANGATGDQLGMRGGDNREDVIVDGNCGSMIAAAEAGNIAYLHLFGARIGEAAFEIGAQLASAVEMTAHVGTDANLRFRRRREVKMRIKTCDAMNLVERRLVAL